MLSQFDGLLETRHSESSKGWSTPKLICCECGKSAQGNACCDDGELCDDCACEDVFNPAIDIRMPIADSIDGLLGK